MGHSTLARALGALAVALGAAASGCGAGRLASSGPASTGSARVAAQLSQATSSIARLRVTVSPGDGASFTPIVVELTPENGAWSAYVTGIPAGAGRLFEGVALDAGGTVLGAGSARSDIAAGASAAVTLVVELAAPAALGSPPVLDSLSTPTTTVAPGSTTTVEASAHDPDGEPVSYLWSGTCGSFDDPSKPSAAWTAPSSGPTTCELDITASNAEGSSVTAYLTMTVTSGRTVSGTRLVTYWPDPPAAQVTRPAPDVASGAPPSALVPDGAGTWTVYPGGALRADGTFVPGKYGADGSYAILGVPAGPYVLCGRNAALVPACTETTRSQVDLGYDLLGRPDAVAATDTTPVTLGLSGLYPWDPVYDEVQVTSSGAGVWDAVGTVGALRGGDTSGSLVEDWSRANASQGGLDLLEPTDVLFVHQLSARPLYALGTVLFYRAATEATAGSAGPGGLTGLAFTDGRASSIIAALAPLALDASVAPSWAMSSFEAYLASLGPAARLGSGTHALRVGASAFTLDAPAPVLPAGSPVLLDFELPAGLGAVSGTLYYGRFLPALWLEWIETRFTVPASYLAPGATTPFAESASLLRRDPLPLAGSSLVPAVSPVRSPQLNGQDALSDLSGVTATPTFSWSPPDTGTPTAYLVEIFALAAQGATTVTTEVLHYSALATSFTVPPGLLESGATYYAKITALVTSVPYDATPFRSATALARAEVLTGTFVP